MLSPISLIPLPLSKQPAKMPRMQTEFAPYIIASYSITAIVLLVLLGGSLTRARRYRLRLAQAKSGRHDT